MMLWLAGVLPVPGAAQQASPHGPEFQVNAYTTSWQTSSSVAIGTTGDFVIAWISDGGSGSDQSESSVQARRYAETGAPLGSQFQVNTYTFDFQTLPALASSSNGEFVVVWDSYGGWGNDTSFNSIQARIFDGDGVPVTEQFQVNTLTAGKQLRPDVVWDSPASFVVAWEGHGDGDGYGIWGQRFNAAGQPLGVEFQVNTYTSSNQRWARLASPAEGVFVVAWQSAGEAGNDPDYSIHARPRFSNGDWGDQFRVNTFTTSGQMYPDIVGIVPGGFVVVWQSQGSTGTDSSGRSIQSQRFSWPPNPAGTETQVNSFTWSDQAQPAISADQRGNVVVVWQSDGSPANDFDSTSIQGQRYSANGEPYGVEFEINSYTTGAQNRVEVASRSNGDFVATWSSEGSSGTDLDNLSIQAQRFDGLFSDGFESGDSARWSWSQPTGR